MTLAPNVRFLFLALVLTSACHYGYSQTLEDYKQAWSAAKANDKGTCDSIPYEEDKKVCQGQRDTIAEKCKNESWFCQDTAGIRENISRIPIGIANRTKDLERFKEMRSRATSDTEKRDLDGKIEALTKEISRMSETLDKMKRTLDDEVRSIEKKIETGKACLAARETVQKAFERATTTGMDESRKQAGDSEIKSVLTDLLAYWENRKPGHTRGIEDVTTGIKNCETIRSASR